jgi:hypothetical protein
VGALRALARRVSPNRYTLSAQPYSSYKPQIANAGACVKASCPRVAPYQMTSSRAAMEKRVLGWVCAALFMGAAHAQTAGVVNLSATPTSGLGSVTPTLTWSTNPVASSCTASGGWSGTKAASGTQALTAIRANTNYTLTCTWGTGSATVSWNPPTTNTDGTPLTNLASYRVVYGTSSSSLTRSQTVSDPTARSATVASLSPATWYFGVKVVNSSGVESATSNVASKAVSGGTAAKTVSIAVTPPSGQTTQATNVWDMTRRSDGQWIRRSVIGYIPLGRPCYGQFGVSKLHYLVNRADVTRLYGTPSSSYLVVNCVG